MSGDSPLLFLAQPARAAIAWFVSQVSKSGLQVLRTFDLQSSRHRSANCPCPHHGTEQCDCQLIFLLVYGFQNPPISIIAHSHQGMTWFTLVDTPQQKADAQLVKTVRRALLLEDSLIQE